ncbi:hypothetical protein YPPY66_5006 [Yersinia pestis PY-66]|uniref:Uncharacterized protein n=1 Tax=Yersinia pestis PY-08 TaxID=992134 RepID=A0AB72ZDM0_YERPE|nr:hypothetical protein YPPY03_4711 [Yersinia pestis PY-03]EIQ83200.1 hypothetical protein YPPY01_4573 [Yersinia pestis PY-01]EIQ83227.1 hypothetical protein YPPY02_4630 [Yersinia pestis PY-02]EIQ97706.1 hypothetical protein YPPY05_4615 [Yersinia pestis PY-05]EIR00772.1 hypothetical protein YPPY06_4681 [Yersinia pestis PY-06]EIR11970.1 hypothetical protein YPPY08_4702 [Yersinia pestis PY-08]EIR11989.1 hypothetical protein YPPY07_4538 [Yersinia pestis PY-07]EIR13429.1 hypothetical protein YPP
MGAVFFFSSMRSKNFSQKIVLENTGGKYSMKWPLSLTLKQK